MYNTQACAHNALIHASNVVSPSPPINLPSKLAWKRSKIFSHMIPEYVRQEISLLSGLRSITDFGWPVPLLPYSTGHIMFAARTCLFLCQHNVCKPLEWNLSNQDTLGTEESVLISEEASHPTLMLQCGERQYSHSHSPRLHDNLCRICSTD